jgi:hypothetical protein
VRAECVLIVLPLLPLPPLHRPSRPPPPLSGTIPKDYLLALAGKYGISFGPGSYGGLNPLTGEPLPGWCPQHACAHHGAITSPQASLFRDGVPNTS